MSSVILSLCILLHNIGHYKVPTTVHFFRYKQHEIINVSTYWIEDTLVSELQAGVTLPFEVDNPPSPIEYSWETYAHCHGDKTPPTVSCRYIRFVFR